MGLELGYDWRASLSALDCRTVRQRRLTWSFRLASLARKLSTLSCTAALLPRHRFPVASCLAQPQARCSQILPDRLAAVGRGIVPDQVQRSGVPLAQLHQKGGGGSGVAVALQFHPLHFPGLQAHRRVVAGLLAVTRAGQIRQSCLSSQHPLPPQFRVRPEVGLVGKEYLSASAPHFVPQGGVLRHEGLTFGLISLDQPPLGALEGKLQPVQVVEATAAAQPDAASFQEKLPYHLPPEPAEGSSWSGRCPAWRAILGPPSSTPPAASRQGRGEPPVCSKIKAAGPPPRRQTPIVRWCEGPVPVLAPSPMTSSLGPAARSHTNAPAPAPGAWAPESSADANP